MLECINFWLLGRLLVQVPLSDVCTMGHCLNLMTVPISWPTDVWRCWVWLKMRPLVISTVCASKDTSTNEWCCAKMQWTDHTRQILDKLYISGGSPALASSRSKPSTPEDQSAVPEREPPLGLEHIASVLVTFTFSREQLQHDSWVDVMLWPSWIFVWNRSWKWVQVCGCGGD